MDSRWAGDTSHKKGKQGGNALKRQVIDGNKKIPLHEPVKRDESGLNRWELVVYDLELTDNFF